MVRRIDCHMHVRGRGADWSWDHNDRIIEAADALGIEKLAVSIPVMRGMPDYATVRRANDDVITAMKQYPERILGYSYIVPGQRESLDEISRCLDAGMIGIKLYNQYTYPGQKVLGEMDEARLAKLQDFYLKSGFIKKKSDVKDLYTNQFVK